MPFLPPREGLEGSDVASFRRKFRAFLNEIRPP